MPVTSIAAPITGLPARAASGMSARGLRLPPHRGVAGAQVPAAAVLRAVPQAGCAANGNAQVARRGTPAATGARREAFRRHAARGLSDTAADPAAQQPDGRSAGRRASPPAMPPCRPPVAARAPLAA